MQRETIRQLTVSAARLVVFLGISTFVAFPLSRNNYSDYFSSIMIRVHADAKYNLDAKELAQLLIENNFDGLQDQLDRNFNVYALVITDCTSMDFKCNGQNILFSTNPKLLRFRISRNNLSQYQFFPLFRSHLPDAGVDGNKNAEIIGRVYSISTIPTFTDDYRLWLRNPFGDNELWKKYLATMAICLGGGVILWMILELLLKIWRIERKNSEQREAELVQGADNYVRQLEEKEAQIEEQGRRFNMQFESYINNIRELEQRLQNVDEYREIAETIIKELEEEKSLQSITLLQDLEQTNQEKLLLQQEIEKFRASSRKDKQEATKALGNVINPPLANRFEREVFRRLSQNDRYRKGDWRIVGNFDVAIGKDRSQFIDLILIAKECVVVLEVKNYDGLIAPDGDLENSRWFCTDSRKRRMEVKSTWGDNPYHQVHEYTMSVMHLVQRSSWQLPVYGVIVFPDDADTSKLTERIGKFYRVTTLSRLVTVLDQLIVECRRNDPYAKRPTPEQVENIIRGKGL